MASESGLMAEEKLGCEDEGGTPQDSDRGDFMHEGGPTHRDKHPTPMLH